MRKAMTITLLMAIVHFGATRILAQDIGFMGSFGGATFQMDDMKDFQKSILSTYPVEGKIISSFPPYTGFSINIFKQFQPALRFGGGYAFTTTGGKSNYTDYSGSLQTMMIGHSHRFGVFLSYAIIGGDHFELSLFGRVDANMARMEVSSTIYAYGLSNGFTKKYKSLSPNTSAGLELLYRFNAFSVGVDGGFLVDFPGELSDSESGSRLYDPVEATKVLTADWTGYRVNLKVIYWLKFE